MTVLLQDDSLTVAAEWLQEIQKIIDSLNGHQMADLSRSSHDQNNHEDLSRRPSNGSSNTLQLPNSKKSAKVGRTKSLKLKILGSTEDILEDHPNSGNSPPLNTSPGGAAAAS